MLNLTSPRSGHIVNSRKNPREISEKCSYRHHSGHRSPVQPNRSGPCTPEELDSRGRRCPAVRPREITLTFSEKVEQAFSGVTVVNDQGKEIATEKAKVDAANRAVLHVLVPALPGGVYTVTWAVAGHDAHRRKGDFKFTVK